MTYLAGTTELFSLGIHCYAERFIAYSDDAESLPCDEASRPCNSLVFTTELCISLTAFRPVISDSLPDDREHNFRFEEPDS